VLELGIACAAVALIWAGLLVANGGYWLTSQRLPSVAADPGGPDGKAGANGRGHLDVRAGWPAVTAVVPARNEAPMLPVTVPTLLAQDYPGEFTITVVDDGSTDGTAAAASALRGVTVIAGQPREPGWAGKVWAMAQGLDTVTSEYVLFTDADIAWDAGTLRRLVRAAELDNRDLVSQMAVLRAETRWERAIVPAFVYFFAQLYPFRRVNQGKIAAAAGGCMLVRRSAIKNGLAPISDALIDDVAFGKMIKRDGGRCWLGLATGVHSVRPYPRLADLWQMIARSAYTQLRYRADLLIGTLAGLLLLYALPPAGAVAGLVALGGGVSGGGVSGAGPALAAGAGLAGWLLMSVSFLPMLRFYRLSPLRAPTLPLIALMYAAMTADSARRYYTGEPVSWRNRA
jgi:hopene-associated glycosyltransferase HpnB